MFYVDFLSEMNVLFFIEKGNDIVDNFTSK